MPLFRFVLKKGWHSYRDVDGGEFRDTAAARQHGYVVARELMRNREAAARHWRLEVRDDSEEVVEHIVFASIDELLIEQCPQIRHGLEQFYRSSGSLSDTIAELRKSIFQIRATLARADKAPYLAAIDGERL